MKSTVQSILFRKDEYSVSEAKAWLKSHGYSFHKMDETEEYYRFRQAPPGQFRRLRTETFGKGIKAILGIK